MDRQEGGVCIVIKKKTKQMFIYNIVLISGVQHNNSDTHTHISFRFSSLIGYYKILNIVPYAIH